MAKIINTPKPFKPVFCKGCGCAYAYENGDKIYSLISERMVDGTAVCKLLLLECPICGTKNVLEKENAE